MGALLVSQYEIRSGYGPEGKCGNALKPLGEFKLNPAFHPSEIEVLGTRDHQVSSRNSLGFKVSLLWLCSFESVEPYP